MQSVPWRFPRAFIVCIAQSVQTAKEPCPCCASTKCGSRPRVKAAESSLHDAFVPEPTSPVTRGNARVLPGRGVVASARTAVKDRSPLRAPRVPRSSSLTASSHRLRSFHRRAGAPPSLIAPDSDSFYIRRRPSPGRL